jgi:hypothetical protein
MSATQTNHPWRATVRTVIQAVIAAAAAAPLVYTAVTQASPGSSTGAVAVFLTAAGAVTRVSALPAVDRFIRKFIPWLAPDPAGPDPQQIVPDDERRQNGTDPTDIHNGPRWS